MSVEGVLVESIESLDPSGMLESSIVPWGKECLDLGDMNPWIFSLLSNLRLCWYSTY